MGYPMSEDPWRTLVEAHFRVYDSRTEPLPGGAAASLYFVMFPSGELESRYETVRKAVLAKDPDAVVFLRSDGGEDILVIAPRPALAPTKNTANIVLFVLTIMTTLTAGILYWHGYKHAGDEYTWSLLWSTEHLGNSLLYFVLPLIAILGIHESAHFIAARRHGLRSSLPFFIPFPPIALPIGTLGAFIRLKDPLPDRKALFDVGASGPLAGFAVAIPVLLIGAVLTDADAFEAPDLGRPIATLDGIELEYDAATPGSASIGVQTAGPHLLELTSAQGKWPYQANLVATGENGTETLDTYDIKVPSNATALLTVTLPDGYTGARLVLDWDDGLIHFGDSLFVKGLHKIGLGDGDYLTHPTFFAGWVGLLVTGINLLPVGQLDGGHVSRAVFGDKMRYPAYAAIGVLFFLGFQFNAWILMTIFILLMGLYHPPPLNDRVPLDAKRKLVAALVLVVFLVTFIPVPVIL